MGNEDLKNALRTAGLTPEEFADIIQVDPKTVQRWVAGATTPYPRHRASISRSLGLGERELWPEQTPSQTDSETGNATGAATADGCDLIGTWAHADHQDAPSLVAFINDTTRRIDVLDSCCGIQITSEVTDALLAQADTGRQVRILTDGQTPHWEALLGHDSVEIYLCEIPGEYWLIKTTDGMLLTINLEHEPGVSPPPMLQFSAVTENGLFDRLTKRFEELWALTGSSEPIDSQPDPVPIEGDGHKHASDPELAKPDAATGLVRTESGSRRWPRRPA